MYSRALPFVAQTNPDPLAAVERRPDPAIARLGEISGVVVPGGKGLVNQFAPPFMAKTPDGNNNGDGPCLFTIMEKDGQ